MVTDRNKFNFVTICIGFGFLLISVSVAYAQATSNVQQETNQQQTQQQQQQTQQEDNQAAIATITVVDNNNIKDEKTNAILNEPVNGVVHAFSPRLDYSNEWRPVGRGDPLKNDPTFDYSPPTLEHVRYWAETTKDSSKEESGGGVGKQDGNAVRFAKPNQIDILMLGMPNEHLRGGASGMHASSPSPHKPHPNLHAVPHQPYHHHAQHVSVGKNAKGEMPLLQPKYTSVRRSYYAQHLPTRLMPPPMQSNSPPINTFNLPMKPSQVAQVHTEYRHGMSAAAPQHVPPMTHMGPSTSVPTQTVAHMKMQHYPSISTPPAFSSWMYSTPPVTHHYPQQSQQQQQQHHHYITSSGSTVSMPTSSQSSHMPISHGYDSHPQDSHHYFSYTRPSSSNSMSSHMPQESYSPNSIWHSENSLKQSGTGRKPWLHELLQKEVVKTSAKPNYSMSTSKHVYESTKPIYERMPSTPNSKNVGFTPITPVTYVSAPPTIATTTTTTTTTTRPSPPSAAIVYTTPRTQYPTVSPTSVPQFTSTTSRVIYTTPTTTTTPRTTTSSRLLIPTTSNLAYRPTVAPMQMTTDSLFSHYKQPEAPLRGPMYLIIEGHSKVKKYGKNGINLNLPKIVPVIPKREPVVRIAEPGEEKRGTPETFHVEHLHVKTSTTTTTTTTTAKPATTPKSATTAKPDSFTTAKPTTKPPASTMKPMKLAAVTNSTAKPPTSTTTTTARPAATTASPKTASTQATTTKTAAKQTERSESVETNLTATKPAQGEPLPKLELPNEPPTGMAGLLSLLDSSLGGLFDEQPLDKLPAQKPAASAKLTMSTPSTVLQAVNTAVVPVAANARIGTNAGNIVASDTLDGSTGSAEFSFTIDVPPREVRQVFDYDQRPESRLKDVAIENFDGAMDEGASSAFYDDDDDGEFGEYEDIETAIGGKDGQPIKRMDRFVDDEEGEFVGDYEDVELEELGLSDVAPADRSSILVRTQAKMA